MALTNSGLTQALGQFVADLSPKTIPDEAVRIARRGFIDCIGTMIAGRNDPAPQILRKVLDAPAGPASLYFSDLRSTAPEAAWINGAAAHVLDYDDVAMRGHTSTVLVPAILAEAEQLDLSGREMIVAYIAGYETWGELLRRDSGLLHAKGWHPTGIFGAVAAAAACASLRHLDATKATMAIALGASQSAGIMANFGTMTKSFHAGRSAHSGVMAARLAEAGFTSSTDALEHPQGFLHAVSPGGHEDRTSETKMGETWAIISQGLSIKKYPTCYCTHRSIDAALGLVNTHPVKPEEVKKITVTISEYFSTVLRNHLPQTGLAAKFSIEFAVSSAIIAKRVGLAELTDGFVQKREIQEMMGQVAIVTSTALDPEIPGAAPFDKVSVEMADGRVIESQEVSRARGHAVVPLTDRELYDKFADCLATGQSELSAETLFGRLQSIQEISARQLTALR
jgi:2-methylcitrate dehydratase PrpD